MPNLLDPAVCNPEVDLQHLLWVHSLAEVVHSNVEACVGPPCLEAADPMGLEGNEDDPMEVAWAPGLVRGPILGQEEHHQRLLERDHVMLLEQAKMVVSPVPRWADPMPQVEAPVVLDSMVLAEVMLLEAESAVHRGSADQVVETSGRV